jgi:glyoxylase-like metal-dependent hydrolase (beta-lactamase superfamily II)
LRVAQAEKVAIVLTHGHSDHAAAAPPLAAETGAEVFGPEGVAGVTVVIRDGDAVQTDAGELVAIETPGHTREHICLHWRAQEAVFAGDLVLGEGDTTWVAEYPGCVSDYLASLARVREVGAAILYPTHGPPIHDPAEALDRYEQHRRKRIAQVSAVMTAHPHATLDGLLDAVYGDTIDASVRPAARRSLEALVHHVRAAGRP